jgi:hypothetical protein
MIIHLFLFVHCLFSNEPVSTLHKIAFVECSKLANIVNILLQCPSINSLHIQLCKKITNEALLALLRLPSILSQIISFSLLHNTKITDTSVQELIWRFGSGLKYLDLTGCTKIINILAKPDIAKTGM